MKVRFHLPDFADNFKFNLMFLTMLENSPELFREGVEVASVYGVFPPSIWNGGRLKFGLCTKDYIKGVIKAFNSRGIPPSALHSQIPCWRKNISAMNSATW